MDNFDSNAGNTGTTNSGGMRRVVVVVVVVVVLALLGWLLFRKGGVPGTATQNGATPTIAVITHAAPPADWKHYDNKDFGIRASYPADVFKQESGELEIPAFKDKMVGTRFIHSINMSHCPADGKPEDCTPTTDDMTVGFFFLGKEFSFIEGLVKQNLGSNLQQIVLDGRSGFMLAAPTGEGEGIFQYFFPVQDGKGTMIVTRTFIDETVAKRYQGAKNFMTYYDQTNLFTQMLAAVEKI